MVCRPRSRDSSWVGYTTASGSDSKQVAELGLTTDLPQNENLPASAANYVDEHLNCNTLLVKLMAKKPYKPPHQVRSRLLQIRISEKEAEWLFPAAERLGITVSSLMREGARFYARELEQKGEPRKEKSHRGSQKKVISARQHQSSGNEERDRLQASISKAPA